MGADIQLSIFFNFWDVQLTFSEFSMLSVFGLYNWDAEATLYGHIVASILAPCSTQFSRFVKALMS